MNKLYMYKIWCCGTIVVKFNNFSFNLGFKNNFLKKTQPNGHFLKIHSPKLNIANFCRKIIGNVIFQCKKYTYQHHIYLTNIYRLCNNTPFMKRIKSGVLFKKFLTAS